ncbi:MAG: hypothetical protein QM831_01080 [Kofleriaceae bacterium]
MKAFALVVLIACSHGGTATTSVHELSPEEHRLALLPPNPQIVVEIDLARLRKNAVVGETATAALNALGTDSRVPGLPLSVLGSPLASADQIVLAAYGVGTTAATTLTLVVTKSQVPNATQIEDGLVALGPEEWIRQIEARAALKPTEIPAAWRALRAHAEPKGATGAVARVTANLSFDARVALARMTGFEAPPEQLSLWSDVADDFAVVIDAEANDPGDKTKKSARGLAHSLRQLFNTLAESEVMRSLGVPTSFSDARLIQEGQWVRAVIDVGPRHLTRVARRAREMWAPGSLPAEPEATGSGS